MAMVAHLTAEAAAQMALAQEDPVRQQPHVAPGVCGRHLQPSTRVA